VHQVSTFLQWLRWVFKAAVFILLFAFALNNRDDVSVSFLWGYQWRAPMVLVLFTVFALGVGVGVAGMVPRWWRQRRLAQQAQRAAPTPSEKNESPNTLPEHYGP